MSLLRLAALPDMVEPRLFAAISVLLLMVVLGSIRDYDCAFPLDSSISSRSSGNPLVPAMFVFGDSLVDNGNNNYLKSIAKANYYPYGIDFNGGPTGRFSNGYTVADEIGELLGLPLIPAYYNASGEQIRYGVNYASAGAGILDDTGKYFVQLIPFNKQIENFMNTVDHISEYLDAHAISHCIFFVWIGSNDYINKYLIPHINDTRSHPQQFADLLSQQFTQQLTRLNILGARKFVIVGLAPLGCIPYIIDKNAAGICSEEVNQLVMLFNINTKRMVDKLNANLPGSNFIYIDVYAMFQDLHANYTTYGFDVINQACCRVGAKIVKVCLPLEKPCEARYKYVFWDAFHPTEALHILFGRRAFNGNLDIVYPMNIHQLANL